jgi:3-hydroxyacyl-[acyl-carrier-protein] dehydratase
MDERAPAVMKAEQILGLLPHRYPFLLIDRVLELTDERVLALKNVTINEPYFPGHFPHHPVMPGVMIIEALAQAAAILTFTTEGHKADDRMVYYFVGIDNARFKRPVTPGDALHLDVSLVRHLRGLWKFHGIARVDDAVAAEADLLCTIRALDDRNAS